MKLPNSLHTLGSPDTQKFPKYRVRYPIQHRYVSDTCRYISKKYPVIKFYFFNKKIPDTLATRLCAVRYVLGKCTILSTCSHCSVFSLLSTSSVSSYLLLTTQFVSSLLRSPHSVSSSSHLLLFFISSLCIGWIVLIMFF
jgi:hypothetical protein